MIYQFLTVCNTSGFQIVILDRNLAKRGLCPNTVYYLSKYMTPMLSTHSGAVLRNLITENFKRLAHVNSN